MPRFPFTPQESTLFGIALQVEADSRGLSVADALAAAANLTTAELRSFIQTRLTTLKTTRQGVLSTIDAQTAATKTAMNSEIAAIDSALAKVV